MRRRDRSTAFRYPAEASVRCWRQANPTLHHGDSEGRETAIKLGKPKHEDKVTLKDLRTAPIWMAPYEDDARHTLRPVLARDPDVTREIFKHCYAPAIFCTVRDHPKLFARGWYIREEKHLSMLRFWQDGTWVDVKQLKTPRPLALVAVPKIEGKANVEFYLLTRYDIDAPRIGGRLYRWGGPDKFKIQKLGRDMVPTRIKDKARPRKASKKSLARAGPPRVAGAKLGPLRDFGKISLKDRIKHPVWVTTYEEGLSDEDAQRAVISRDPNVSADVLRKFLQATVTFRVSGTDVYGAGIYDREKKTLSALRFWAGKRWEHSGVPGGLTAPVTLVPLCRILGKRDVRFVVKTATTSEASWAP